MDSKFLAAIEKVKSDNIEGFLALIEKQPSLATDTSSKSHPNLLQCVILDGVGKPNNVGMAAALIDRGADTKKALVAAASMNNVPVAELLLSSGVPVDGPGGWSPIEEALYFYNTEVLDFLLKRGASVSNLRIAAGLGRMDEIRSFFDDDGSLKPNAGSIAWPFGELEKRNDGSEARKVLIDKAAGWTNSKQEIIDNAFVYACMHNHLDAAEYLLNQSAQINEVAPGFDYSGTGLHYAALVGHMDMVRFLIDHGADVTIRDTKVNATASGWADHGGHPDVRDFLLGLEQQNS